MKRTGVEAYNTRGPGRITALDYAGGAYAWRQVNDGDVAGIQELAAGLRVVRRIPELGLLEAMLDRADRDLQCLPANHREHVSAMAWINSEDRDWPLAFLNVCEMLVLDDGLVRQRLLSTARTDVEVIRYGHANCAAPNRERRASRRSVDNEVAA